jgi:hypothetical protein
MANIARAAAAAANLKIILIEASRSALIWEAARGAKALRPHGHTPGLIADAGAPDSRPPAELNDISSLRGQHPNSA